MPKLYYEFKDRHTFSIKESHPTFSFEQLKEMKINMMTTTFIDSEQPYKSHPDYQTLVITAIRSLFNEYGDYTVTDLLMIINTYFDDDKTFNGPCKEIFYLTNNIYIYNFYEELLEYKKTLEQSGYYSQI